MKDVSYAQFKESDLTIDAVARNITIIGEAARNISDEAKQSHAEIPWKRVVDMRNKVMHGYFGLSIQRLWDTLQEDLPSLRKAVEKIKSELV